MKGSLFVAGTVLSAIGYAVPLEKRKADYISSCGETWMAGDNVNSNAGKIARVGYNSAVDSFCAKAGGQTVAANKFLSMVARVWLDYGENPTSTGLNGFVYFEIHNKRGGDHVVNTDNCKTYLKKLSSGGECYGKDNHDTKGGTYQVGADDVSYHALANKLPSSFESMDKTVTSDSAITALGDGGKGNTLAPFPTYVFNDVVPVKCHSHNDYERDTALYSALQAGCISVEADVYNKGGKLIVSHDDPGDSGPTFQDLYVTPLKDLLDQRGAIFPGKPDQGLDLLVDFKGAGDQTWDLVVQALQPLRDAGYLSHYDNGFQKRLVTVIASGNAVVDGDVPEPIAKVRDANPGQALFVDARVDKDMSKFDTSNSYLASADFKKAVQGGGGQVSGGNLQKLRDQLKAAHDKGFAVRYWDVASEGQWQQLIDEGVDRLNVDNLQNVAKLDFKL
ncbi:hypothetical protein BDV95DRAFT_593340 [Massariosphaeria phaeospora]|uniref:Altered inheritance of mitochondria protein 6 n=1 Tax=Massariosphaeria phaeospora TaxID=100035 RepID=A0A7C8IHC6_9PLEO|nr:hypothetical protein BDV95DRAFT_593340 [Massariosphaeria phaeospora]